MCVLTTMSTSSGESPAACNAANLTSVRAAVSVAGRPGSSNASHGSTTTVVPFDCNTNADEPTRSVQSSVTYSGASHCALVRNAVAVASSCGTSNSNPGSSTRVTVTEPTVHVCIDENVRPRPHQGTGKSSGRVPSGSGGRAQRGPD